MKNPELSSATSRMRLDQLLVERGYFASRARARDAILRSVVTLDGKPAEKPGHYVSGNVEISVRDPASRYVHRAALKLVHGLDMFALDVKVRKRSISVLNGGFTQVLLERGASHVTAIDVGSEQMHPRIRQDPRVTCLEGVNARYLTLEQIGAKRPDFLVFALWLESNEGWKALGITQSPIEGGDGNREFLLAGHME